MADSTTEHPTASSLVSDDAYTKSAAQNEASAVDSTIPASSRIESSQPENTPIAAQLPETSHSGAAASENTPVESTVTESSPTASTITQNSAAGSGVADSSRVEITPPESTPVEPSLDDSSSLEADWPHLIPDESCTQVTADGGVLKKVLVEGTGEKPELHARCLVHFIGRLSKGGTIFHDTKKESESAAPAKVVAGRDVVKNDTGLNLGVATMVVGEKAVFYIEDPKYGWGEKGNFSFPSIPPNAKLVYEVELVDFENVNEEREGGMLYEEKLEAAERRRKAGNDLFKEGKYKEALLKYAVALSYLDEDFMMQLDGFYWDKAVQVTTPIQLNMAACQLKTGDYNTAIYNCGKVLENEPGNVKALYRRARARHSLGQTQEALEDLEEALKTDPNDQALLKELAAVKRSLREERKAEAQLFKGQFKAPKPASPSGTVEEQPRELETRDPSNNEQAVAKVGLLAGIIAWLLGLLRMLLGLKKTTAAAANRQ